VERGLESEAEDLAWMHTAVSQKVHPNSIAFNNTGSASSRLRLDPSPKLMPIAPKPGVGTWMLPKGRV
jgi:hypothetical protein